MFAQFYNSYNEKTTDFLPFKKSNFPQKNFIVYINQLTPTSELATHIFIRLPDHETGKLY